MDLNFGVHAQGIAQILEPVTELHILDDRQKIFVKAAAFFENRGRNHHGMGGDVVGIVRFFSFGIVDEDEVTIYGIIPMPEDKVDDVSVALPSSLYWTSTPS